MWHETKSQPLYAYKEMRDKAYSKTIVIYQQILRVFREFNIREVVWHCQRIASRKLHIYNLLQLIYKWICVKTHYNHKSHILIRNLIWLVGFICIVDWWRVASFERSRGDHIIKCISWDVSTSWRIENKHACNFMMHVMLRSWTKMSSRAFRLDLTRPIT